MAQLQIIDLKQLESTYKSLCWQVNSLKSFLYTSSLAIRSTQIFKASAQLWTKHVSAGEGAWILPPQTVCLAHATANYLNAGALSLYPPRWNPPDGGSSPQVRWSLYALFAGNFECCQNSSTRLTPPLHFFHNTSHQFKFSSYQILIPEASCFQNTVFYHLPAEYLFPLWKELHTFLKAAGIWNSSVQVLSITEI